MLPDRSEVTVVGARGRAIICDRLAARHAISEVVMLRLKAMLVTTLLLAAGSTGAFAGDFVPRSGNGFAPVGDDAGARSGGADVAAVAAMSETDAAPAAALEAVPAHASAAAVVRPVARVGADDVGAATHHAPAAAADDEKVGAAPVPAHKTHGARWQSLLPGVMK
jgi:hypothetical protein